MIDVKWMAPIPRDEEQRLETLYHYRILDTVEEESFDDICRLAASVCETPISLITLIDRHRQWFKAHVGLDIRETDRECSFCAHAILENDTLVIEDATHDARFRDNPLVLSRPCIRFYGGEPLHAFNGQRIGTLCVIDQKPRQLTEEQKANLRTLARRVEYELELRRLNVEIARLEEQRKGLVQFVVHDLNNPLSAIQLIADSLARDTTASSTTAELVADLLTATGVAHRLVCDLRDIGVADQGHLAPRWQKLDLDGLFQNLRGTARSACRDADVSLAWQPLDTPLEGDPDLLARVLQNLVFNAIDHSPQGGTITIRVTAAGDEHYLIAVDDEGSGVSADKIEHVFDMYARDLGSERRGSRGIGLAFCRTAVEAHGGRIGVSARSPQRQQLLCRATEAPTGIIAHCASFPAKMPAKSVESRRETRRAVPG